MVNTKSRQGHIRLVTHLMSSMLDYMRDFQGHTNLMHYNVPLYIFVADNRFVNLGENPACPSGEGGVNMDIPPMVRGYWSADGICIHRLGCPPHSVRNGGPDYKGSQGLSLTYCRINRHAKEDWYQGAHPGPHLSPIVPLGEGVPHGGGLDQHQFRILPTPGEHPV